MKSPVEGTIKLVSAAVKERRILDLSGDQTQLYVYGTSTIALAIPAMILYTNPNLQKSPWAYRLLFTLAFATNVFTVGLPGRIDGQVDNGKIKISYDTIFAPAAYAFAIWSVIYLSQLANSNSLD